MGNKKKGIGKTLPMRVLDEKGIPYQAHNGFSTPMAASAVSMVGKT